METKNKHFKNGEFCPQVSDDYSPILKFRFDPQRGINEQLMELFLLLDAYWRFTHTKIFLNLPYIPYLRQDKAEVGEPLSARLIFQLLETLHIEKIYTVEPHFRQLQGFTSIPLQISWMEDTLPQVLKLKQFKDCILVAPDEGRRKTIEKVAERTGLEYLVVPKVRTSEGEVVRKDFSFPKDKHLVIIDDMIDSGGTMLSLINDINNPISIIVAHAICSDNLLDKLPENVKLYAYDTIRHNDKRITYIEEA